MITAISSDSIYFGYNKELGYYKAASCGMCFQVICNNIKTADGTGKLIDSKNNCNDKSSIIVTVTDVCLGGKDSKCGSTHLELGSIAFSSIANLNASEISIKYRAVPCNFKD